MRLGLCLSHLCLIESGIPGQPHRDKVGGVSDENRSTTADFNVKTFF
jgi:hypothetical protein